MPHELPLPPAATSDPRSLEMIRVWVAKKKLHCVLNIGHWQNKGIDEADAWGVLIADMIHHIADAHEAEFGRDKRETANRVRAALNREMMNPTSQRLGEFVVNHDDPADPTREP